MLIRWLVAALHLLALGIGLGAVWVRARALRSILDPAAVRRALAADAVWGIAALVWITTGLARAFAGLEKTPDYYLHNHAFWGKMGLLVLVLLLEIWPMSLFIGWRIRLGRGEAIDTRPALVLARISEAQALLVVAMVFAATAMARGIGF